MNTQYYTYVDSVAGMQTERWDKLSALIAHIENGDGDNSDGLIYQNSKAVSCCKPILFYHADESGLYFSPYAE
jgi:hypothetical protein